MKIVKFLEKASRLLFLTKAGGGFIFAHSLLQDHFAENNTGNETARTAPEGQFGVQIYKRIIILAMVVVIAATLFGLYTPSRSFLAQANRLRNPVDPLAEVKILGEPPCDIQSILYGSAQRIPTLTITNNSGHKLVLYWIEFDGRERFDGVLENGESFSYPINDYWGSAAVGNAFCLRDPETGEAEYAIILTDKRPEITINP